MKVKQEILLCLEEYWHDKNKEIPNSEKWKENEFHIKQCCLMYSWAYFSNDFTAITGSI